MIPTLKIQRFELQSQSRSLPANKRKLVVLPADKSKLGLFYLQIRED